MWNNSFKLLVCGFWDGKSFIPLDFSLHREKSKKLEQAENSVNKAKLILEKVKAELKELRKKVNESREALIQARELFLENPTRTNKKNLAQKENALERTKKRLSNAQNDLKNKKKRLEKAQKKLSKIQDKHSYYGLSKKEFKSQYKKSRKRDTAGYKRAKEADSKKTDNVIKMLKRAVKQGFVPDYVLTDSWFFCFTLLKTVIEIGRDIDLISMAKIGIAKYELLPVGKSYYPAELIKLFERKAKYNRELKSHYIKLPAKYQGIRVNMFFIRMGRSTTWRLLITTDLSLSFKRLLEIYQIRWSIEVFFKECKQYLNLGKCYSSDFDAQIADTTLSMIQYVLLSYYKRTHYQQSIGGLFKELSQSIIEESLQQVFIELFNALIELFAEIAGVDIMTFYEELICNPKSEEILKKFRLDCSKNTFLQAA